MTPLANPQPRADASAVDRRAILIMTALAVAVASQAWLAFSFGALHGPARARWPVAMTLILLLALPTAGIIFAIWRSRAFPIGSPVAVLLVVAGVLMRVPYFGIGPLLEDDHFRYLLDGAMVARGLNPYTFAPELVLKGDSALPAAVLEAGRATIAGVNFPDLRTIYPGGAQALFALAHLAAPWSIDGLRSVVFLAEALTAVLLVLLLRRTGQPMILVGFIWCNPLLAFSLTGQAHIDAALVPPILAALLLVQKGAGMAVGTLLGFAIGVKLWPALLAPLLARALWPHRGALAGFALALGLVSAVLCGPLILASLSPNSGLTAYAGGWSVNNAPFAWASYGFYLLIGEGSGERLLRAIVVGLSAVTAVAVAVRPVSGGDDLARRAALLTAALFYLSPAQFPWYSVWFLPLAAAAGSLPLSAAAVGLPFYYLFFPLVETAQRDVLIYGLAGLHLLPVALTALLVRRAKALEFRA